MARKHKKYSEQEKQIALIFYERVKYRPDAIAHAAKLAAVEETALRAWVAGIFDQDEEPGEKESLLPSGIPMPPEEMQSFLRYPETFAPAHDLAQWTREQFIEEGGILWDEKFFHLQMAVIAFEWTNIGNQKHQNAVAATTQLVGMSGSKWDKGREIWRLEREWGEVPHFLITVDSVQWCEYSEASRCALIDHELRHCGMKLSKTGEPKFNLDGTPQFALQGHDFEGFVDTMRRFGYENAAEGNARRLAAVIDEVRRNGPIFGHADIRLACGNCL